VDTNNCANEDAEGESCDNLCINNINKTTTDDEQGKWTSVNYEDNTDLAIDSEGNTSKTKVEKDDFIICKVLGRGGFGKVVQVTQKTTKEVYAMKVLHKDFLVQTGNVSYSLTERNILLKIRHPYIVSLHYAFQTKGKIYLVMDYMNGGPLFYHLRKEAMFSEDMVRFYAAQMALSLEHLHSLGIIHRDLKPENILLNGEGHIALTDFGFAKEDVFDNTSKTICGTIEYMAPEMIIGTGHGKSVDWWGLGILIYDMLTGSPPFQSKNRKTLENKIIKEKIKYPQYLTRDASSLISGLCYKDSTKRFGCTSKGTQDIKKHPFFKLINWKKMLNQEIKPPFRPETKNGKLDISNFDTKWTKLTPVDSPTESCGLTSSQQNQFLGFSYVREDVIPL